MKMLFSQILEVPQQLAVLLEEPGSGVYFDWGPDSSRYLPHVDKRPALPDPDEFLDMLGLARHQGREQE